GGGGGAGRGGGAGGGPAAGGGDGPPGPPAARARAARPGVAAGDGRRHPRDLRAGRGARAAGVVLRRVAALPPAGACPGGRGAGGARALGAPEAPGAGGDQGDRARPRDGQGVRRGSGGDAWSVRGPSPRGEGGAGAGGRPVITIEQFGELELKVGTVKSAERHPKADRLVVLRVDLGGEERQLVAGIRAHYAPEALVGRQIVVVANLTPATLRGVE